MFGCPTNASLNQRLSRRAARNARSRCGWSEERHGSADCPSFLRLNARPAAYLIPKHHDGDGSRYNVRSHRDRHGCRLAWARPLVLAAFREEHFSGRIQLFGWSRKHTDVRESVSLGLGLRQPFIFAIASTACSPGLSRQYSMNALVCLCKSSILSGLIFPTANRAETRW
jgi:hypothetical protein